MECGVRSVVCVECGGVWSVKCGAGSVLVECVKCRVWSVECRVKCRVWSVECRVSSVECREWSVECKV